MLRLFTGQRRSVEAFRGAGSYTEDQLLSALTALVERSRAERILTLDHDQASFASRSGAGSTTATTASAPATSAARATRSVPVTSYLGYTMTPLKANLDTAQAAEKEETVRWYIANRECHGTEGCTMPTPYRGPLAKDWHAWLRREYPQVHDEPRPGEIVGDVGRTTRATGRDPAQCLDAAVSPPAVRITGCNGTGAQQWDVGRDRTVRPRSDRTLCLTARTSDVALTACGHGRLEQTSSRNTRRLVDPLASPRDIECGAPLRSGVSSAGGRGDEQDRGVRLSSPRMAA